MTTALVRIQDVPVMQLCQVCPKPGSCCTGFTLNIGEFHIDNWEAEAQKKLNEYGLDFFRVVGAFGKNKYHTGEHVEPLYGCTKVKDGRCTIYESRPQLCRNFKPMGDPLCCMFKCRPQSYDTTGCEKKLEASPI